MHFFRVCMAKGSGKVIVAAIAANLGVAAIKFVASVFTGSTAMASEGIHSLVDAGDGALLWFGRKRSRKPPDNLHPFGHGKELYFWSLVVSLVIFALGGAVSIWEGVGHVRHSRTLEQLNWSYWVLALSAILEAASLTIAAKQFAATKRDRGWWEHFKKSKDPTDFMVVFEDSAGIVGVAFAFCGIYLAHRLHRPELDGVASICIGLLLCGMAVFLAYESEKLLVGERAAREVIADVESILKTQPEISSIAPPLTMQVGPENVLLAINVRFTEQAKRHIGAVIERIEAAIRRNHPEITHIFIEAGSLR
jgi:cation diffusion facilitator family transporter